MFVLVNKGVKGKATAAKLNELVGKFADEHPEIGMLKEGVGFFE